jgi:hypothetical protein
MMKPRDRVINSIERSPIDRVPLDGWFRPETMIRLREYFKTDRSEEVLRALGIDIRDIRMDPPES